ncbi:ABC transporter ATP-binding protein [Acidaminobacter sp. JC074]|uniref:ABC transporter ATP-binding protein n=1 Tax=Acidaminobacter sp. JC074 TaxID=2530199 RepID=UPI001F11662F|nr:ABC transporter ATP-binding protein [Acidaminobacter sp. JC074]MCH4888321.1 ABC transporter ATP-binding protein [Acidaminobacter sp. JC074]
MKRFKIMFEYMKGNVLKYIGAIVAILLAVTASLIVPLVVRTTIDSVIGTDPIDNANMIGRFFLYFGSKEELIQMLWLPGILVVTLTIARGVFLYFKGKWSAQASETIAKNLRDRLYGHLQELSYEYHVSAETGDLIQRCTSDVDMIRRFLGTQMVEIFRAIFMIITIAFIVLNLDMNLGLISLAVVPVIFFYSYFFFKRIQRTFKVVDEAEGAMSTTIQENLTGVRVVRAFGRQAYEIDKFEEKNAHMRDSVLRLLELFAQYWSSSDIICLSQSALVLCIGTVWTVQGKITLGTLFAFTSYVGMLLWPVRQLGRILTDMSKAFVAIDRTQEILQVPSEMTTSGDNFSPIKGSIEFDHVSFEYEEGRKILDDISFKVNKGETLAILGPTGSGKSTLVHLMARLYDVDKGSIKIDGIDVKDYNKKHLREHVGLILQEPFLFAKNIRDNIKIAKADADHHHVENAAKTAVIHDKIVEFNEGYETLVGERGVSLSGGQKQRMAIARRIITDAPVVIFDDSLSAVDTETDSAIRHRLKHTDKALTTIIISHRVSTLSEADRIMILEDGKITDLDTHDALIKKEGLYKRIWEIQNAYKEEDII